MRWDAGHPCIAPRLAMMRCSDGSGWLASADIDLRVQAELFPLRVLHMIDKDQPPTMPARTPHRDLPESTPAQAA